ncbi:MAG TPA: family 78 glycoside hydrolase catalytic domain [Clostridia bacterium]|nr:family 78 glycoside hydrolase catalytic domain [Clostridia bacterium]
MNMINHANWIKAPAGLGKDAPQNTSAIVWTSVTSKSATDAGLDFNKNFVCKGSVKKAELQISALGIYQAMLNGERVGDFVFAPGWTSDESRLQYQSYDVTGQMRAENNITVTLGRGWRYLGKNPEKTVNGFSNKDMALIATLEVEYEDGTAQRIATDKSWLVTTSKIRYSNLYNGDIFDAGFVADEPLPALEINHSKEILIPQQGEKIVETQRLPAKELIKTPAGETVIDFGQNLTGYVEFKIQGKKGDKATIQHAEVLDKDGNFYTENLRSAKQEIIFICDGQEHTYKPVLSFQGFRYIKLLNWPDTVNLADFTAIVVHSDMERTGFFECSDKGINQLFENIIWGQRGNFLDVPTDCPQRDERLGWTGDAQVFARTASYNFDVEKFFVKWLADLAADQGENGSVPHVIPDVLDGEGGSAAWGDAAVICPWQMYLTYANKTILESQFNSMKKWLDFIQSRSKNFIWNKGDHFGDWLNLEEEVGNKGTDKKLIATAFAVYSTSLFIKIGQVLGKDMSEYELLRDKTKAAFCKKYIKDGKVAGDTQTACVLALYFDLTNEKEKTAAQLEALVRKHGHLTTGFVGAPYLLHVLTANGYVKTAYDLMFRKEYPSWLYPIGLGATTIWERWNGIRTDGTMEDKGMNSFNHYAYGAVGDWMYGTMAGINTDENAPGFKHIIFKPIPDDRLDFVKASIMSRHGQVKAEWQRVDGKVKYTFTVPQGCTATAYVNGARTPLVAGTTEI